MDHSSDNALKLLQELVGTPGVAGREDQIRGVIQGHVRQLGVFDEIKTDALGSLICVRKPRPIEGSAGGAARRVLVSAHMDQIGFLVSGVSSTGMIYLHPIGSFDPRTLFARRVSVISSSGESLPGIMNAPGRPVHTASPEELKSVPELARFFVDVGLPADIVQQKVSKGDMIVPDGGLEVIGDFFVGSGLDNRVGCWALISALESIGHHDSEIVCAWTAQEELGSRGAGPVAFGMELDIGISCDTTVCCDVPGVDEADHITSAGKGVALQIADSSTLSDMQLISEMEAVAQADKIPTQRSLMLGGGQDGALIQRSRRGVRTAVLGCPIKHMHTNAEMVHRTDLFACRDLILKYLQSL